MIFPIMFVVQADGDETQVHRWHLTSFALLSASEKFDYNKQQLKWKGEGKEYGR